MVKCLLENDSNLISQGKGYGRYHHQENIQFCRQARGSLFELVDHLTVALDEKYIDEEIYKNAKSDILEIIRLLNGYIKYLTTRKRDQKVE